MAVVGLNSILVHLVDQLLLVLEDRCEVFECKDSYCLACVCKSGLFEM